MWEVRDSTAKHGVQRTHSTACWANIGESCRPWPTIMGAFALASWWGGHSAHASKPYLYICRVKMVVREFTKWHPDDEEMKYVE